ncbi:MAG: D-alanine--D-alanine ligase [Fuerstiella sp.]
MKIVVLAGGQSAERDVSLQSGTCLRDALQQRGHDVTLIDPRETDVGGLNAAAWEIALPLVHGTGGEDGELQRQLAAIGMPWVGSSAESSELTFDKIRTNELLKQHGLPVPESVVVSRRQSIADITRLTRPLGPKLVAKPPRQGSSIGVSIVSKPASLADALQLAFQYDDECLVERFISGRELTVAVVDGTALPAIEIVPVNWYDYQSKYSDERTRYLFVTDEAAVAAIQLAVRACQLCGVTGIARVDLRVDEEQQPWILEVNTIPGMTTHSLVPMAAEKAGLSVAELWEQAIQRVL